MKCITSRNPLAKLKSRRYKTGEWFTRDIRLGVQVVFIF